jgi:hypothetical protein
MRAALGPPPARARPAARRAGAAHATTSAAPPAAAARSRRALRIDASVVWRQLVGAAGGGGQLDDPAARLAARGSPPPRAAERAECSSAAPRRSAQPPPPTPRSPQQEGSGAWVAHARTARRPRALIHFLGGAFAGAAPQVRRARAWQRGAQQAVDSAGPCTTGRRRRCHGRLPPLPSTRSPFPPLAPTPPRPRPEKVAYHLKIELLAEAGFTVVATPYRLTFKHLDAAREVSSAFSAALAELRASGRGYLAPPGAPVVGVGHSNGALLHLLIGAVAPGHADANVLVSYNNK